MAPGKEVACRTVTRVTASFGGDDLFVSEYVESEFLSRISRQDRAFLTRTAVLERMCGPLCDAVLEQSGSAEALADLARSNLLLVPLDRRGKWYRCPSRRWSTPSPPETSTQSLT